MSKYTTQVRFICETLADVNESAGYGSIDSIIDKAIPKVFDFDFPIFDDEYRVPLCKKILKHYYTREIGLETVGLWKHFLSMKLNEIMPFYNQLYQSELIKFNPLDTAHITTRHVRDNVGAHDTTNKGESSGESTSRNMFSDTPQGALDNIENESYLTNASKATNNGSYKNTENSTSNTTSTEEYIEQIVGRNGGSASKLLRDFRKTFLNIDMMVINELADLFMNLW